MSMGKMIERYFIVHTPPHDLCGKYKTSVAAANFCWPLINSGIFDKTFCILPSNVGGLVDDIIMEGLSYSSFRCKGNLLQKIAPFIENWTVFRQIKRGSSVWFYNIGIINFLLYWLLKIFKPSVRIYVIILDIYVPKRKFSFPSLILWMMNHCQGTIRLANSEFFTCKNSICMPGVVPSDAPLNPRVEECSMKFLLSGQLREDISQTKLVIEAFSRIPNLSLYISGFPVGVSDDELRQLCAPYPNIHYYGNVEFRKYLELLHECPFFLSTRDPRVVDNQCNFPSKVIEAILHNRIIISTIHYGQLNGLKYFEISSSLEEFVDALEHIAKSDSDEILSYANQSDYVKQRFSPVEWGNAIIQIENKE